MRIAIMFLLCATAPAQIISGHLASGQFATGQVMVSPTPRMGWSSWPMECGASCYAGGGITAITEAAVKAQTDNLANPALSGLCAVEYPPNGTCVSLLALGYSITGIFETGLSRDGSGNLQCVPANFPSGCTGISAYIHAAGGKVGMYGTPGATTFAGYAGQYGHFAADATLLAAWNVDYWYCDWSSDAPALWGSTSAGVQNGYKAMGDALAGTGRRFSYLVNYPNIVTFPPTWFAGVGGTSVRIGDDNMGADPWYAKATRDLSYAVPYQNKGHWLDFDILMGNLSESNQSSPVGDVEARAQFNFSAIVAAPLFIGSPIQLLDATNLQTYSNSEVIAVDQDTKGQMGTKVSSVTCGSKTCDVWVRVLANGDYAVALLNFDPSGTHTVSVSWSDFGQSGTFNIRDLWSHSSVGSSSTGYSVSVPAWGSAMVRLSR